MTELPADVIRLVIAARRVAFADEFDKVKFTDPEALEMMLELDRAADVFSERVP